jgi:hypothetical protein
MRRLAEVEKSRSKAAGRALLFMVSTRKEFVAMPAVATLALRASGRMAAG